MFNDHLDPVTEARITALETAAHWDNEASQNPDGDNLVLEETTETAWLAYRALTVLAELDPTTAEAIVRQAGAEVSSIGELAVEQRALLDTDSRWVHESLNAAA